MSKRILCCHCGQYKGSSAFESKRHKYCKDCEAGNPKLSGWRVVHGAFVSPEEQAQHTEKPRPKRRKR